MKKVLLLLAVVGLLSTACGSANQAETEAPDAAAAPAAETTEAAASAGVAIALITPEDASVPMGDAELVLQVVDPATNEPVAVENLEVDLSMPMDGMDPMTTMAVVEPGAEAGQYKVMTNLGMEGMWMMTVKSADAAMPGEAVFNLDVK
ncbi:FixH family protein [Halomicronema sp. CCY15110]|uniref:FixH family protein n=1 Tax=Halomicronema sp. CCY15110 TaxID=2767773 RepID=UPI0019506252|nr:FixH family protein [Halomicronema sp. CCY15110]